MDRRLEIGNVESLQFRRWRLGLWDLRGKFWVLGNLGGVKLCQSMSILVVRVVHCISYPDGFFRQSPAGKGFANASVKYEGTP